MNIYKKYNFPVPGGVIKKYSILPFNSEADKNKLFNNLIVLVLSLPRIPF